MTPFEQIVALLSQRHPGVFVCQPSTRGLAKGLEICCHGRQGNAFVYERSPDGHMLLALSENEGDGRPEVWSTRGPEEIATRLQPWAFSAVWTRPQPIDTKAEKRRLEKIAQGLLARNGIQCVRPPLNPDGMRLLTDDGKRQLEEDLESLSVRRIAHQFPWDAAGQLELKTVVLLRTLETTAPPGKDRNVCLAAVGPERRRDEQRIAIQLLDLIVVNQTHRWERAPWLWKNIAVPADECLGTEKSQSSATGEADARENQRAVHALRLLDEGRIEEALAEYGVTLSSDLRRVLGGERINPPACCAHPDAAWTQLLVDTLRQSAPWLLPKAVVDEAERLRAWAAQKKGRSRSMPNLKLAIFPGQFHARKASLMLTGDKDGRNPHLMIEATASNARLADTAWQRPIAVDFLRHGVPFPAD